MANSYWQGTADGNTAVFAVPFPYLEQSHVHVQVNGVEMMSPGDFTWVNDGSIRFKVAPPNGNTVSIYRQTSPDSALVTYNNGAVLTATDLNTATRQNFYRTQELQDKFDAYINAGVARYSVTGANPYVTPSDLIQAAADAVLQSSLATTLLSALTDIATNASDILAQTSRVDTLQGALDVLTSGVPGGIGTYLTNETNSRIDGDLALQSIFDLMGALNGNGDAFILNSGNVYVDASTSMADRFAALDTAVAGNTAAITSEASTRASADSALSTSITALTSTVNSNNTAVTAAIASEATTRAAADSANASSITSLTTTVNGNTASIATQATSINGLQAQYTVRLNVNGHVAGFGLASGAGGTSDFTVVANHFSIIDNSAGTPVVPFTVSGGVCYIQNVVIDGALIQNATINTAQIANLAVGTAKIAANAASNIATNTIGSTGPASFTQSSWQQLTSASLVGRTDSRQVIVTVSVDADVAGSTGSFISARIRRLNNGSYTTLWEGLSDSGTTGKSYAQIKGSFTIIDVPPTNGLTNSYTLEVYGSGGTSASYYTNSLVVHEVLK